ncbi:TRAP-type C4-dicarboxylate transport system, small permease component [Evansella caseinilytica]|uniref:TRAP-type C4-dicarboxylate transport system, small permease component n=1 Tax=Evansella caseinilytica TaxID=1503961 RepID=A0A1H3HUE0_9BACI|nr:TRAP transporter small permease [Evansella caseinilytica]SDY19042.1 TRAP-type C4-dicarboxylate transport system, small permease component [Evansella caseinilytica]
MQKTLDRLFSLIDILTGILTGLMVAFVFYNVVLRVAFNSGLTWSEELARYLFVFVTYIGAISAMRSNAHIGIDTLLARVNDKAKLSLYIITQLSIAGLMFLLIHGSIGMISANAAQTTAALAIPFPVLYSVGVLTGISITLLALGNIVHAVKNKENIGQIVKISSEEDDLVEEAEASAKEHLEELVKEDRA